VKERSQNIQVCPFIVHIDDYATIMIALGIYVNVRIYRYYSQTNLSQSTVLASPQMHHEIVGQLGREMSLDD
jgi:hypothetical protein